MKIDAKPVEDVYRSNVPQDDPVKLILSVSLIPVFRARENIYGALC